eukprot:gene11365-12388_t
MNVLPEVIYDEILSYLSYEHHIPFASINVILSKLLLKRIFRDKIHSLIVDPYEQLKVEIALDPSSMIDSISCKELSTTAEIFVEDIPCHVRQIKVVEISSRGLDELLNNMDEAIRRNFTIELWRKGINFLRRAN